MAADSMPIRQVIQVSLALCRTCALAFALQRMSLMCPVSFSSPFRTRLICICTLSYQVKVRDRDKDTRKKTHDEKLGKVLDLLVLTSLLSHKRPFVLLQLASNLNLPAHTLFLIRFPRLPLPPLLLLTSPLCAHRHSSTWATSCKPPASLLPSRTSVLPLIPAALLLCFCTFRSDCVSTQSLSLHARSKHGSIIVTAEPMSGTANTHSFIVLVHAYSLCVTIVMLQGIVFTT
jgi:hypothetical protein